MKKFIALMLSEGAYVFANEEYHLIAESDCNEQTKLSSTSVSSLETNSSNLEVISKTPILSVTSSDFSNIICKNLSSGITIEASPAGTQTRAVSPSNYDTFCSVDKIQ